MKLLRLKVLDDTLLISEGIEADTPCVTDQKVIMLSVANTLFTVSAVAVIIGVGMALGWQYAAYLVLALGAKLCLRKLDEMKEPAEMQLSVAQLSGK